MNPFRENIHNIVTLYNYDPLCRETSRFVNLRGKLFSRGLARVTTMQSVSISSDVVGSNPTQGEV
jgi:hypothetical protein